VAIVGLLVYYNLNRRHGSLKRELKVRTPFEAVECWYRMNPELFITLKLPQMA
jgi:hypothetical protein